MKFFFIIVCMISVTITAQNKRALTIEDLWAMNRVESFTLSPDGSTIAFEVRSFSIEENKGNTDIFLIDTKGNNLRPFKNSEVNENEPRFHPDGKKISFVRGGQIWIADPDGKNESQLTNLYSEVSDHKWSSDGKKILFISKVYPECTDDDCNKRLDEEKEKSKVKAQIFDNLMYRHWNEWRGDKRSHLFLFDVDSKTAIDLNLKSDFDVPPIALGSKNDFGFSPVGNEAAYTMNQSDFLATSTNNDIFIINVSKAKKNKSAEAEKISESLGNDNQPVYSPDGKYIAFTSMKRAGFEADKQDIILYDRSGGDLKNLTDSVDISANEIIWSPDSKIIYFTAANEIYNSIYKLDISTLAIDVLVKEHSNSNIAVSSDGSKIYFRQQRSDLPNEIFSVNNDGSNLTQITSLNKDLLAGIEMSSLETFWSEGDEGAKVQSMLIKPPFFNPEEKYPMIFLIHGGPQGHWTDEFHYRWNYQLFASKGYVVVAPNPRGSTGYGQKFTDEISGDWGGKVYTDLMNACDYALKTFEFIDEENTFAAGASYGGYMINWIAGHSDRFNALVSHDGVFNLESSWGTTEELWFPEWEFGGTPWQSREIYEKWSPHRYIHNAKTPMLIIQGANDFRVAEEQAFQLFTYLQRLNVESKLLYFPDEYHWVVKPQNSVLWWNTVFEWINKHKTTEIQ
ncbi:MAG: S9 family peptidase [Ignavibacteriaceae bacterium]